jgi:hypothetical protein
MHPYYIPCTLSLSHAMHSIPITYHALYPHYIPYTLSLLHTMHSIPITYHALSPLHTMHSIPITYHALYLYYIPCTLSLLHTMHSIPITYHALYPRYISCCFMSIETKAFRMIYFIFQPLSEVQQHLAFCSLSLFFLVEFMFTLFKTLVVSS